MEYRDTINRIMGMTDYERVPSIGRRRPRYNLDRIGSFMATLNNQHLGTPTVHIAGTKGKGSTAAMVSSVLKEAGYLPGLFTSPHLHSFRERIQVNNNPIPESDFALLVEELWNSMEQFNKSNKDRITLFEFLTAMAFTYFKKMKTQINVIEVGLGGRLDATNLVRPTVCGITTLGLDHTEILGNTLDKIAWEKSGIIKSRVPVITASQDADALEVIKDVSKKSNSSLSIVGTDILWHLKSSSIFGQEFDIKTTTNTYSLRSPLAGEHQIENASVALGIVESLVEKGIPISLKAIQNGFLHVKWPCRLELINENPKIVVDGAHNPHSAVALVKSVKNLFPLNRIVLVIGVSGNKDLNGLVEALDQLCPAFTVTTRSRHARATDPTKISAVFTKLGKKSTITDNVSNAVTIAQNFASKNDVVLVTGSLFVAAEAREFVIGIAPEIY